MSNVGGRGWFRAVLALIGTFVTLAALAPMAGAVLVDKGHGHLAGVLPVKGVSSTSFPGRVGAPSGLSTADNLNYHGGIVLHGEAPYLIFWDPGNQIAAADKTLYERFFADGAHDSGLATNVYGVDRQFTDTTGFANYDQVWDPSHAITDTQAYPSTGQCTENGGFTETACLYDAQIQTEVQRLITADSLPSGETGHAPIYFVVTPPSVNSCFADNSTCADNFFCAYHGVSDSGTFLYADMATILDANNPKSCQFDGNSAVQEPNSRPIADVMIKAMSHEYNETITDPVNGGGWYKNGSGNEDGDQCNFFGSYNPSGGSNPNAFTPTLGGSAVSGTLFNQSMNGNPYYTQSEWSNGDGNCVMQPTSSAIAAAFTAPSLPAPGTAASFDPSASTSAGGYTSTTWSWGDGNTSFARSAPAAINHTYSAVGTYNVTLTLVDPLGNLSTVTHSVTVTSPPAITTNAATSVTSTGATLNSTINPNATDTTYKYEYGPSTAFGTVIGPFDAGSGTTAQSQPGQAITGLAAATTYYYRLCGNNAATGAGAANQVCGSVVAFTTSGGPTAPSATTQAATGVSGSAATLPGLVNAHGSNTSYTFQWGTNLTTDFNHITTVDSVGNGTASWPVSGSLTGLTAGTTYFYRLVATNTIGTTNGAVMSFTTPGTTAPAVTTGNATNISSSGATLNGTVNPEGQQTAFTFEYGPGTSLGHVTAVDNAGNYGGVENVSLPASGLTTGTTYCFRIVATNNTGTATGALHCFTTS